MPNTTSPLNCTNALARNPASPLNCTNALARNPAYHRMSALRHLKKPLRSRQYQERRAIIHKLCIIMVMCQDARGTSIARKVYSPTSGGVSQGVSQGGNATMTATSKELPAGPGGSANRYVLLHTIDAASWCVLGTLRRMWSLRVRGLMTSIHPFCLMPSFPSHWVECPSKSLTRW